MKWLCLFILLFIHYVPSAPSGNTFKILYKKVEVKQDWSLVYGIPVELKEKLERTSITLGIEVEWLAAVINSESKFDSKRENSIGAIGFIQFLPITLRQLKIPKDSLLLLSDTAQINIIERFYRPVSGKIKSVEDLHLYTFFPMAVLQGWGKERVLETSRIPAHRIAKCNSPIDLNKDLKITVGEYKYYVSHLK